MTSSSRRRTTTTIDTNLPPLVLSADQKAAYASTGKRLLQLSFPMLRSLNRQYGVGNGNFYTNADYAQEEHEVREAIAQQVLAANWHTTPDDFYILVFDFAFPNLVKQDIDGPRKATGDCLQQKMTRAEKKQYNTKSLLATWTRLHPPGIYNDGQILQELVVKHTNQDDLTCWVTIFAMARDRYIPVPLAQMLYDSLLAC